MVLSVIPKVKKIFWSTKNVEFLIIETKFSYLENNIMHTMYFKLKKCTSMSGNLHKKQKVPTTALFGKNYVISYGTWNLYTELNKLTLQLLFLIVLQPKIIKNIIVFS